MGLDGVMDVSIITRIGRATVTFNETKVTLDQMKAALKARGFYVSGTQVVK